MTIHQALRSLDRDGKYAAKRPSMNGYIYIRPVPNVAEEAGVPDAPAEWEVVIVAKDGAEASFVFDEKMHVRGTADMAIDAAFVENVVFADDWETSPRESLEIARSGSGRW